MNKSILAAAAAAFAALAAGAWEVSVLTGGTNIMIAPPAHHALASANAKARTALETVSQGEYRRSGPHLIVAAHGGVTATNIVGSVVTNIAGSVTNVVTNLVVSPLTVPVTGLSGYDGTNDANAVRWYRVPLSRTALVVQASALESGKLMNYVDGNGDKIIESTQYAKTVLEGYDGPLYGNSTGTNGAVNVFQVP